MRSLLDNYPGSKSTEQPFSILYKWRQRNDNYSDSLLDLSPVIEPNGPLAFDF